MSLSNFLEDTLLDLVFNASAYSGQSTVHVQLHIGDPGDDGTANTATETTRAAATFGAASGGTLSNDADISWLNLAGTETISHVSLWDADTSGNNLWNGPLNASKSVNAGDNLVIPTGDLDVTLS